MKIINQMLVIVLIAGTIISLSSIAPEDKKNLTANSYCPTASDFQPIYLSNGMGNDYLSAKEQTAIYGETDLAHMLCVISEETEQQLRTHTPFPIHKKHYWLYRC